MTGSLMKYIDKRVHNFGKNKLHQMETSGVVFCPSQILANHIVFALVMRDPELCRGLLQLLFPDREIAEVRLHDSLLGRAEESDVEKTIIVGPESHSVRLDVLFTDNNAWYDIEMRVGCGYAQAGQGL